jgi:hypothetical protein
MVGHVKRSWNLNMVTTACQDSRCTLHTFVQSTLETCWATIVGAKMSSHLTTTFSVLSLSHDVTTRHNTTIDWIPRMANVSMENNGA